VEPEAGVVANARGPRDLDDLGRRAIIEPLVEALRPSSVLVCWIDQPAERDETLPVDASTAVRACRPSDLAVALELGDGPDVIWIRGYPTWHTVRSLAADILAHGRGRVSPPALLFEGGPWYASQFPWVESAKEGVRLALSDLAAQLDADATALWCAPGRGAGAFVPSVTTRRLDTWLRGRRALLDALRLAHQERLDLVAREFALFELLEQSQHDGNAVVRSFRFRLGTRLVRLGRMALRKEAWFRASGAILARQRTVAEARARLAAEQPSPPRVQGGLRVTYLLPELRLSGGAIVVMQLVNELRSLGVDAGVVALKDARPAVRRESFRWRLFVRPKLFPSVEAMMRGMPETDVLIATHWSTAPWVRALVDAHRAKHAAYFLQDYEPWFFPEQNADAREAVKNTYGLIPDKIATSAWLRDLVRDDGYDARKIPLGADLGFFYPRPVERRSQPVVLAMARPRTPRRGFEFVVASLAKVHEVMPSVDIVLFGENIGAMALPFPYRSAGVVTDRDELARLYSGARVHFDGSEFQAFGLPALEAMACGAVSVLTDVGGVQEYARHDENCLLVAPDDPDLAAAAIVGLLSDDALHERLRTGGLDTSRDFSMRRTARETFDVLAAIAGSPAPR
jgi:glycosyltransferase involved in cell wall biosynthesis